MYGIKDGRYGLFPSDFVERMSPQTIRREMRVITKVTRSSYRDQYNQYNEANNNNNLENGNNIGKKRMPFAAKYLPNQIFPQINWIIWITDSDDNYDDENGHTWDSNRLIPRHPDEDGISEVSASAGTLHICLNDDLGL